MNSFISFYSTLNNTEKQKYQEFVASKINSLPSEVKSDWEFEALRKVCNDFCAVPTRKSIWTPSFERVKFDPPPKKKKILIHI